MDTKFELRIKYVEELNWSLLRAGVPLVHKFEVANGAPASDLKISIGLEPYVDTLHLFAGDLAGNRPLPEFQVNWDRIWEINAAGNRNLHVLVNGYPMDLPIWVLAPDEWRHSIVWQDRRHYIDEKLAMAEGTVLVPPGGTPNLRPSLMTWDNPPLPVGFAALVQSELPRVREIKNSIVESLKKRSQPPPPMDGYGADIEPLLKALFEELRKRYPNHYRDIQRQSLEEKTQSLRLAFHDVWNGDGNGATCIDLVVLGAAILEAFGAHPGLVMIGNDNGDAHALLSCWRSSDETVVRTPLLRESQDFLKHISPEQPELLVLDLTELAAGSSFEEALRIGQQYSRTRRFLYMVDIYETRY